MEPLYLALVNALLVIVLVYFVFSRRRSTGATAPRAETEKKVVYRIYSEAEVRKHISPGDLWLVIDGKVYDFSEYYKVHPGGDAIFRNAGRDSSAGFHGNQWHSI